MEIRRTGPVGPFGLGPRGHYSSLNTRPENNVIVQRMNEIVDEYNIKINEFKTYEEQYEFFDEIERRLKELSDQIVI
jgi:hypothetical protein